MPYLTTLSEDIARARALLNRGRARAEDLHDASPQTRELLIALGGGGIDGADTYAAYRLLESFVSVLTDDRALIQRLRDNSGSEGVHLSFVADEPGRPVAAPCAINGCCYAALEAEAHGFNLLSETLAGEGVHGVKPLLPEPRFSQDVAYVAFLIDKLRGEIDRRKKV